MARKICITEEQYNMALKEGVTINADLSAANNDPAKAFNNAKGEAEKQGIKKGEYNIQFSNVQENRFLTKKQLQESRLKALKENSEVYTVKDFLKGIK
jgi:hypothetical protein